ncbi:MAG: hypothetical protein ACREUN_06090 [Burkholderiales bacterium]
MAKTVVGLIHDIDEAQGALHDLVASGIRREDIGFRGNAEHPVPGTAALNESEGSAESHGIVVAVAAASEAQASSALEILQCHGAVELDWRGHFDA